MNYIIYVKYILHFNILRLAHRTSLLTSSKIMIKVFVNVSWHYIKHLYFMWLNFLHLDVRFKLKDILYLIFEPHIYLFVVIKSNPIFSCSMRIFDDLQWSLKLFSTTLRWWRFLIITLIIITNCCVKYPKHNETYSLIRNHLSSSRI